jgi:putative endopeptidase
MRRHMFVAMAVVLPLATVFAGAQSSSAVPPAAGAPAASSTSVELLSLDRTIDACTDFYQFACGGWMAANPMPPDQQRWGRFTEIQQRNFTILRRIVEAPGGDGDQRRASDYYAACMNENDIEAKKLAPLEADLARIGAMTRKEDLPALLAHLHSIGVNVLFQFGAQTDRRDATKQIARIDQGGR